MKRKVSELAQELRDCADLIHHHGWRPNALSRLIEATSRLIEATGELADWQRDFIGNHASRKSENYEISERKLDN